MFKAFPIAAALTALVATGAQAQTVTALVDGTMLVSIDAAQKKVRKSVKIDGNASLVGIDVRPADGKLYGLTAAGQIVIVDAQSGKWEAKSKLTEALPAGATFTVDFNPAADRLRVIASDGTNLRINVDDGKTTVDGKLKFADADASKAEVPQVVAGAYINSVAGTKETALYDVDRKTGALVKQAPPNDGILNTIGKLGVPLDGPVALDILADGKGGNTAYLMAGGQMYTVDFATAKTTAVGKIDGLSGKVMDIAAMPATGGAM